MAECNAEHVPVARHGYAELFPIFHSEDPEVIRSQLMDFLEGSSEQQLRAWSDSIPEVQAAAGGTLAEEAEATAYSAIFEYELPYEGRRPDVVLLASGAVVVVEFKGKSAAAQSDIDQVAAYARDLRCYHRDCESRTVIPVLVLTRISGSLGTVCGVRIVGPDVIQSILTEQSNHAGIETLTPEHFLEHEAYRPMPTLVKAARELFDKGDIPRIRRASARTDPAIQTIRQIMKDAAATKTRHLVLLTGVPGAGKTLVGLQTVHASMLDDLSVERDGERPTAPAVFLSGNGPLVQVLQYELRNEHADGKTFVRDVKPYVRRYRTNKKLIPPEHVVIFDEAQRAWDKKKVANSHADTSEEARSEPDYFIEFAERIPEWCVVIGLIGGGQEIHTGEEAGLGQWNDAINSASEAAQWTVHGPKHALSHFDTCLASCKQVDTLALDTELRFHLSVDLHRLVSQLLDAAPASENARITSDLEQNGFHLRITRSLDRAKEYLHDRYSGYQAARYGMLASSKDKVLEASFGVPNGFQATKRVKFGPWYGDDESADGARSCRLLQDCITEFGAQGLELDASLLAWGTDLIFKSGCWDNSSARGYRDRHLIKDAFQLRLNAYRVLLTRGRDATVIFMPELDELNETYDYFVASGMRSLDT